MAVTYQTEGVKMPDIKKRETTEWIKAVAASYGKRLGEIAYIFCSDEKILEVNRQYLQHDYYTISAPTRIPRGILIRMDTILIFMATHKPCSRRSMFVPLNNTSIPKSGITHPPLHQRSHDRYRQQDQQIKYHQKEKALGSLIIQADQILCRKHQIHQTDGTEHAGLF